jgi:hypothetical protein
LQVNKGEISYHEVNHVSACGVSDDHDLLVHGCCVICQQQKGLVIVEDFVEVKGLVGVEDSEGTKGLVVAEDSEEVTGLAVCLHGMVDVLCLEAQEHGPCGCGLFAHIDSKISWDNQG